VNDATDERGLVRKLVLTGHLSVPERKLLPGRAVKASLIRSVIEEALRSATPFRAWWLPDDSMVGCEIQYRGTASGRVEHHYRGVEGERSGVRQYENVAQAAAALLVEAQPFFVQAIDGVPIDWAT
jgi:hypothetical protein